MNPAATEPQTVFQECADTDAFLDLVKSRMTAGDRVLAYFAGGDRIHALTAAADGLTHATSAPRPGDAIASLTPDWPQFHLFERELYEDSGIRPEGHPWRKPVRKPIAQGEHNQFFRIPGDEIHQVAVGPVHAGVIEPGHFRFQCHGEDVYHLEIALGYQHRGVEKAMVGIPTPHTHSLVEVASGDATIAHAGAYCRVIEQLAGIAPSLHDQRVRAIALELERCACHTGDLGALAGDIGYLPTLSYCGRIRGDALNITAAICGNRFGRGICRPGGGRFAIDTRLAAIMRQRLEALRADAEGAVSLLWDNTAVLARFEDCGVVNTQQARDIGLVGPAARASGIEIDSRKSHPHGVYADLDFTVPVLTTGDVFARARVRWLETQQSFAIIDSLLAALEADAGQPQPPPTGFTLRPNALAFALVEGWRGEVCHIATTDGDGRISRYKIVDPSFHNWFGLALALRGTPISDFPLCNKSFNLSYCGFDL